MMIGILSSFTLRGKLLLGAAALLLIVAVVAGVYFKGRAAGVADTEAKYAEIARKALSQARKADAAAQDTVTTEAGAVAASNDKAREAAANSGDPLAAALESIRSGQ